LQRRKAQAFTYESACMGYILQVALQVALQVPLRCPATRSAPLAAWYLGRFAAKGACAFGLGGDCRRWPVLAAVPIWNTLRRGRAAARTRGVRRAHAPLRPRNACHDSSWFNAGAHPLSRDPTLGQHAGCVAGVPNPGPGCDL